MNTPMKWYRNFYKKHKFSQMGKEMVTVQLWGLETKRTSGKYYGPPKRNSSWQW